MRWIRPVLLVALAALGCDRIRCGTELVYDPDEKRCVCRNGGELHPEAGVCFTDGGPVADACTQRDFFRDADGDGHGDPDERVRGCEAPEGYVERGDDCNDACGACAPDHAETCDGTDEDCDGSIDEGFERRPFHRDADGDTFGDAAARILACAAPSAHVEDSSDCDDDDAFTHPGADERCDGRDGDCDGSIDEGLVEPLGTPRSVSGARDVRANVALARLGTGFVAAWTRITDVGGSDVVFVRLDDRLELVGAPERLDPDAPPTARRVALVPIDENAVLAHWRGATWRARRITTSDTGPAIDVVPASEDALPLDAAVVDGLALFAWSNASGTSTGKTFATSLDPATASAPRFLVGLHGASEFERVLRIASVEGPMPFVVLVYNGIYAGTSGRTFADRATLRPFAPEGHRVELLANPSPHVAAVSTRSEAGTRIGVLLRRSGLPTEWVVLAPGSFGTAIGISWREASELETSLPASPPFALLATGGGFAAVGPTATGTRWTERAIDGRSVASFPLGIPGTTAESIALASRDPGTALVFQQSAQSGGAPGDGWLRAIGCP